MKPADRMPGDVNPTVFAAVIGFVGILTGNLLGPALARLTARGQRRIQKQDDASAAKIAADEADRDRVSRSMWKIVEDLRAEVGDLRATLAKRESQVDSLIEDMAQLRAIERQLRDENTAQRATVVAHKNRIEALETENAGLKERIRTLEGQLAGVALVPPPQQAQP